MNRVWWIKSHFFLNSPICNGLNYLSLSPKIAEQWNVEQKLKEIGEFDAQKANYVDKIELICKLIRVKWARTKQCFRLVEHEKREFHQVFGPFMRCAESNCRNYFNAIRFAFAFGLFAGTISIGNENKEIAYTAFKCSPESTQHTHTLVTQLHKHKCSTIGTNEQQTKRIVIEKEPTWNKQQNQQQ